MKRFFTIIIVLALLGGIVALWYHYDQNTGKISIYTSKPVTTKNIVQTVTATGTLGAVTETKVGSEVSGVIQKIYVDYNQNVKKGQLLAQINPNTLQTQVDKAQASLQKSESSYKSSVAQAANAQATVRQREANVLSSQAKVKQAEAAVANSKAAVFNAEANVRKAQAEYERCQIDYERMKSLREQDLIAQSELDNAKASFLSSKASVEASEASLNGAKANFESSRLNLDGVNADLESARIQVESAREQYRSSQASVDGAKADMEQAKANVESALVDLGKTKICSPADGIVLDICVSEGQTVAAQYQAPELFVLANNLSEMRVEANVDEADIGQVKVGSKVTFTVDAWQDREFQGQVTEVRKSAVTTNNVVTYPVIISTTNDDGCLMPGMTATVAITVQERDNVITIPNTALRFKPLDDDKKFRDDHPAKPGEEGPEADKSGAKKEVVAVNPGEKTIYTMIKGKRGEIEPRKVVIGISDGTDTEIVSGDLKEGERVVTGSKEVDKAKAASRRGNRRRGPGMF